MKDTPPAQAAGCTASVRTPDDPAPGSQGSYALVLQGPAGQPAAVAGTPEQLAALGGQIADVLQAALPEFTRGLAEVIDEAGELVQNGLRLGERDTDLFRIFAHAALMLARNPHVTLDEVLDDGFPGGAAAVRRWWTSWT